MTGGPSEATVKAVVDAAIARGDGMQRTALIVEHATRTNLAVACDPALGEDRMVRLGDVIDFVRSGAMPTEREVRAETKLHMGMTYAEAEEAIRAGIERAMDSAIARALVEHFAPPSCKVCGGEGTMPATPGWNGDPETAPDMVDCPSCATPKVQAGLAVDAVVPVKVSGFLVGVDEHASAAPRVLVRVTECSSLPHLVGATVSVAEWKVRPR